MEIRYNMYIKKSYRKEDSNANIFENMLPGMKASNEKFRF